MVAITSAIQISGKFFINDNTWRAGDFAFQMVGGDQCGSVETAGFKLRTSPDGDR